MNSPFLLRSMLSNCPEMSAQPVRGSGLVNNDPVGDLLAGGPSALSSTMLGTGLPLPALPTNMCPAPFTTTAWALPEFVPPVELNVDTGVCKIDVADPVRVREGTTLAIVYVTTFDPLLPALSVTTACRVLLMATPLVSPD